MIPTLLNYSPEETYLKFGESYIWQSCYV